MHTLETRPLSQYSCYNIPAQHLVWQSILGDDSLLYNYLAKPLLFRMDPEHAHEFAASLLDNPLAQPFFSANRSLQGTSSPRLKTSLCGIPLDNPVGLAAGFDKNATMYHRLHNLGFGFVEVGTVTAKAQDGNPKPRLFRLPADQALINRMGFNNHGVEVVAKRLAAGKTPLPLGGNIGKSKVTPLEEAIEDYATSFDLLKPLVDYFVVNVSSPNTPNLRKLQEKRPLLELLSHLKGRNTDPAKPILLKIAPDLSDHQLADIVDVITQVELPGVIATNTTIDRSGLSTSAARIEAIGAGGLSGKPLKGRATDVIRFLRQHLPPQTELVGVGGIFNGADAYQKIRAGAGTIQIYTGFVYGGQNTVFRICRELDQLLKRDGFKSVADAVAVDL